jgi:formate dehydrogenase maturation protein FdhE
MSSIQLNLGFPLTATCRQGITGEIPTKRCRKCGEEKPIASFTLFSVTGSQGRRNTCKSCEAEMHKLRRKLKKANPTPPPGPCPVCGKHTVHWVLDHSHTTSAFRGYICNDCNLGMGKFDDNPNIIYKAWRYLTNATKNDTAR